MPRGSSVTPSWAGYPVRGPHPVTFPVMSAGGRKPMLPNDTWVKDKRRGEPGQRRVRAPSPPRGSPGQRAEAAGQRREGVHACPRTHRSWSPRGRRPSNLSYHHQLPIAKQGDPSGHGVCFKKPPVHGQLTWAAEFPVTPRTPTQTKSLLPPSSPGSSSSPSGDRPRDGNAGQGPVLRPSAPGDPHGAREQQEGQP